MRRTLRAWKRRPARIRSAARLAALGIALAALGAGGAGAARADAVHVAVATNFAATARALAAAFRETAGHEVMLSEGSTGKLHAQIVAGAPYEVFLAADAARPRRLAEEGHALADSRFVYALGRLALWSSDAERPVGAEALAAGDFRHLAIAHPELAPYGAAARDVLLRLGLWEALQPKLVRGEDVGQTFHFVASGNAELGFVALSQLAGRGGARWVVPDALHAPIGQEAVLLRRARADPGARAFLAFLRSAEARRAIEAAGYGVPDDRPAP